jgi:hypothetical protein
MRTTGRSAALLLAALFCLSACGDEGGTPSAAPTGPAAASAPAARCAGPDQQVRVPAYDPEKGYVGDLPGDMPPQYAANHAFQQRLRLCGEDLERAMAAATRAQERLDGVAPVTPAAVRSALVGLGHDGRSMTVTAAGETVTFVAEVAGSAGQMNVCLDGTVGPDGASVLGNAMYAEGGCIKPVGGH